MREEPTSTTTIENNPQQGVGVTLISIRDSSSYMPLGIAYIAAVLRDSGYRVTCIDSGYYNEESILNKIEKNDTEIVGISFLTSYFLKAKKLGKQIKKSYPNIPIVVGGPHPSILPLEVIKEDWVDFVVIGEGEKTMLDLIEVIEKNENLHQVDGLVFKQNGHVIKNKTRKPIENLDNIPFPARDLLDVENYLYCAPEFPLPAPSLHILTGRGCPYRCIFCKPCEDIIFGKKHRKRSIDNVIEEIKHLVEKYNIRGLNIQDDMIGEKYLKELCDRIVKENLHKKLSIWVQTRPDVLDETLVKKLKNSGCCMISIGLESGSQKILDFLRKDIKVEKIEDAIKMCKKIGVVVAVGVMIGTPTETIEDLQKTINFIKRNKPENVWISYTNPILGSYLYDYARENGLLIKNRIQSLNRRQEIHSMKREIPEEILKKSYDKMYVRNSFKFKFILEPYYLRTIWKRWYSFFEIGEPQYLLTEIIPQKLFKKIIFIRDHYRIGKIIDRLYRITIFRRGRKIL